MEFVVDANILFASLIKEGLTRRILLDHHLSFYVPELIIEEFIEHIEELETKTKVNRKILKKKVKELMRLANIKIVSEDDFYEYLKTASNISPDPDDIMYFALALKLNCPIWSNDKKLKQQDKVKVYSTEELINMQS